MRWKALTDAVAPCSTHVAYAHAFYGARVVGLSNRAHRCALHCRLCYEPSPLPGMLACSVMMVSRVVVDGAGHIGSLAAWPGINDRQA